MYSYNAKSKPASDSLVLRVPASEDGAQVHQLISECPPLDTNSMYCNLLQCSHFGSTSVAAYMGQDEDLVGFISGYIIPQRPDTLFIWQVAVSVKARGHGLAGRMIKHILSRPVCAEVKFLETTITEDNDASWGLFKGVAKKLDTDLNHSVMFDKERHFGGSHNSEMLVRIGPFNSFCHPKSTEKVLPIAGNTGEK